MKVKIQSIYHFLLLKPPRIRYLIILLIIFMALNFFIIKNLNIYVKKDVLITNQEFNLDVNIDTIYYQEQPLIIVDKKINKDYVTYRIASNLDGLRTVTYQTNLLKNI